MNIFRTKTIYMQMCYQSDELYEMTDEERTALQKHLIKMYSDIEKICDRHGLTVMLAYGSALGALRHQNVIPWDDDLDVYMPRKDYLKFIHEYSKELPDNYIIYAPNHQNGAISNFGKVVDKNTRFVTSGGENATHYCGVYVDIFPLDNIGHNKFANDSRRLLALVVKYITGSVRQFEAKSIFYRKLMSGSLVSIFNYWFRQCIGFVMSFLSSKQWANLIDKIYSAQKTETGYLHDCSGWHYDWNPLPKELFLPARKMKFGDIEAYVPNQTEKYVTRCYGDWRQIPPPEKRWRHFIRELDLDKSDN